jgi:hypothetical protein
MLSVVVSVVLLFVCGYALSSVTEDRLGMGTNGLFFQFVFALLGFILGAMFLLAEFTWGTYRYTSMAFVEEFSRVSCRVVSSCVVFVCVCLCVFICIFVIVIIFCWHCVFVCLCRDNVCCLHSKYFAFMRKRPGRAVMYLIFGMLAVFYGMQSSQVVIMMVIGIIMMVLSVAHCAVLGPCLEKEVQIDAPESLTHEQYRAQIGAVSA